MKKVRSTAIALILCIPVIFMLQSCVKDSCTRAYKIYRPVYQSLSEVRAEMKSKAPQPMKGTGKLFTLGSYIFMNEVGKGIHIIDNSNPAAPKNISFINIPGNVDLAVQGHYLYADCYSDIVVFNIANPLDVQPVRFVDNVFKSGTSFWGSHTNPDSVMIISGFVEKDTIMDCEGFSLWEAGFMSDVNVRNSFSIASATAAPAAGRGGSMARFTIASNFLYGVSFSHLYAFNLADPSYPQLTNTKNMGWGIETIYPFQDKLFIGSMSGMFIYSISNPSNPSPMGSFSHVTSCDPVVTDGQHAYVTLRSGTECQGFTNQLEVVDVTNLFQPVLKKTYPMTNPHGLDKDGNILFICDGKDGLRVLNAADVMDIKELKRISGINAYDIIAQNGLAIVVARDGLYQYDYSNPLNVRQLSKITINR